jgi:hypothetical protein
MCKLRDVNAFNIDSNILAIDVTLVCLIVGFARS